MTIYQFSIRLTSDAEPGTGLGGEVVNELIPRDHGGRAVLPASHIKGLMRAGLQEVAASLGWPQEVVASVFGQSDETRPGCGSAVRLTDAVAVATTAVRLVTRTAVEESGVARDATLRTTQSIPIGTRFEGEVESSVPEGSSQDLAWRMALLAISAIGGNRTRGSGACVAEIRGEKRTSGQLLRELAGRIARGDWRQAPEDQPASRLGETNAGRRLADRPVVLRLVFQARSPICCPEIPDKTNVITTGFSIPASTIQGVLLNRIANRDAELASLLFDSPLFRAWPLHPCGAPAGQDRASLDELPTPIRVSLTHRAAKFSEPQGLQERHFFDEALETEPYEWTAAAGGVPLKAADGVLLRWKNGRVRLWKAAAMPHVVSSHGVHSDPETQGGRNLFTVDAMAPLIWKGLVVVPEDVAAILVAELERDPRVAIGKSRTVRGLGDLRAAVIDGIPDEWQIRTEHTVLVVQSPLLLPDQASPGRTAEEELAVLAQEWLERHGLPAPDKGTWASVGIRFGWNRHRAGLQRACRVIQPGSVIAFSRQLDESKLAAALRTDGLGLDGRERGFGAVSVHPGKAEGFYQAAPELRSIGSDAPGQLRDAVRLILEIRQSPAGRLPSPSQIRAVQQRLVKSDKEQTLKYLENQTKRTSPIWFTWEPIHSQVAQLLNGYSKPIASRALEILADMAIVDQKGGDRR